MRALTVKKIYNLFKGIAFNHTQIKDFDYGDPYDVNNKNDYNFPMLFLENLMPISSAGEGVNNTLSKWEVSFRIVDVHSQDITNYNEMLANSLSQSEQIIQSVINILRELKDCGIILDNNWFCQQIIDNSNSIANGTKCSIFLTSGRSVDTCNDILFTENICTFLNNC